MSNIRRFIVHLPITVKVPVVVVLLLLAIGIAVSERVLSRLVTSQERQLGDLANAYLDGLASPLIEPILRGDPWEIFDILDQAKRAYAAVKPVETVVTDPGGHVLASSNPRHAGIGAPLPADFPASAGQQSKILIHTPAARAFVDRPLMVRTRQIGTLHAELDISPLLAERREVLWTLIYSNAALTLLLAALGWIAVRHMVAPMKVLAEHLDAAPDGAVAPIPEGWIPPANTETGRLFRSFNRMAHAVAERESLMARLAEEERLGSLGRLASGMAHEINNPLGGLFNALDTLKVHGGNAPVRSAAIDLLERGLRGIRDVVRSALTVYRADRENRDLQATDIDDLRLLVGPQVRRKQISLLWENGLPPEVGVVAFPVRQVVLNLLLNACRAAPEQGFVGLSALVISGRVVIAVDDSGAGLPKHVAAFIESRASSTPIGAETGLGLWVARRTVSELAGTIDVDVSPLGGARIRMTVPLRAQTGELADVA